MKKILSTILVAVLLVGCVFALASCKSGNGEKPELDLKAAKKALEKEDYNVTLNGDEDKLDPWIEETLTATNTEYGDNLTITVYKDSETAKIMFEKKEKEIKDNIAKYELEIKYYENLLDEYKNDNKLTEASIDGFKDSIKNYEDKLENAKELCYGIDGKIVWYGSADAIKDSK